MDLQHLRASDGTGEAVLAHIQTVRNPGSTVLDLDNVDNWNTKAVIITGTPAANGFVSPVGMKVMYGHLSAGDFIIDGYAPGYVDNGNTTAEVAIVKMTTSWADALNDLLSVAHQDNGKLKTTALDDFYRPSELVFDHVASGCVLTGTAYGSTLAWSLTAGVVYINGKRYTVAAASGSVAASKDTYFDVLMPVSGLVATLVNTGGNVINNNIASPALAANSIRIGIIQSGATITALTSINQGQEDRTVPNVGGSSPMQTTDSLGNLICPRDPLRRTLSTHTRVTQAVNAGGTAISDLLDLAMPVFVPAGRKIKFTVQAEDLYASVNNASAVVTLWEGTVGSGRSLLAYRGFQNGGSGTVGVGVSRTFTPLTSNPTLRVGLASTTSGSSTMDGAPNSPITATVELV